MFGFLFSRKDGLAAVCDRRNASGGLLRRQDENIALLELLRKEAPEFLVLHPNVTGWLASNNSFF